MAVNSFPLSFVEGTLEVNFSVQTQGFRGKTLLVYAYYSVGLELLSKVFTDDLEFTDDLFQI